MSIFKKHLAAIERGMITKTNIIGLRKALNAMARKECGYSVSRTAPVISFSEADQLVSAVHKHHPQVGGELHETGLKLLRDRRYAKRWTPEQAAIIVNLAGFRLVDFFEFDRMHFTPVYRAISDTGKKFDFYNIAWQSGGNGPQIVS